MNYLQMQFFMEQKGYSLADLSRMSRVPEEILERILSGEEKNVDYSVLLRLERVLDDGEPCVRAPQPAYGAKRKYTLEDYYALPEERRVELIDGEFYDMAAPSASHQEMLLELAVAIRQHIRDHSGKCKVFIAPLDVQLDRDAYTMVQPDIIILCDPKKITERCILGAPDLIIEILSPSTRKKDITVKLKKYRKAGVREYWMVDLEKGHVIVYFFEKSSYPMIYGMQDEIPVGIYDGELKINFAEL